MLKLFLFVTFYSFNLLFFVTSATETVYTYDLCRSEPQYQFYDVTGDFLQQIDDKVTYRLDPRSCKKNILGVYYAKITGYYFEVFEGWGDSGTMVDMDRFVGSNFILQQQQITARITLIGKPSTTLHILFTTVESTRFFWGSSQVLHDYIATVYEYNPDPIIIYMSYPSYLPKYGIGLEFAGDLKFEMYHGLSLDQNDLIYGENLKAPGCTVENVRPRFVYGNYVTFKLLPTTSNGTITFVAKQNDIMTDLNITKTNSLETPPCPRVSNDLLFEWSYPIRWGGTGSPQTFGIDILAPMKTDSYLQIIEYNGDDVVSDQTYNSTSNYCGFQSQPISTSAIINYYYWCKSSTIQSRELLFQYRLGDVIPASNSTTPVTMPSTFSSTSISQNDKAADSISYLISMFFFLIMLSKIHF